MKKYLELAKERINFSSPLMLEGNRFYYRNRVIDLACSIYVNDPDNFWKLYSWVEPDIVTTEDRAIHFGVSIGTQVGWIKSAVTRQYFDEVARVKWIFRKEYSELRDGE